MAIDAYILPAMSARGGSLWPADAAADYLRSRLGALLPLYVLTMTPFSIVVMVLIDVVTSEYRSMIGATSWLLVAATIWRWIGLGALQRRVLTDVRGEPPQPLRRCVLSVLLLRLLASTVALWGSILIAPGLFGFLLAGMAAPLTLEKSEGQWARVTSVISWIHRSQGRLLKLLTSLFVLYGLALVGGLVVVRVVLGVLLPAFTGINATDVSFTIASWTGILAAAYLLFLVFDLYWAVLSVMIFCDLQSRRLAPDLRVRLRTLTEASS